MTRRQKRGLAAGLILTTAGLLAAAVYQQHLCQLEVDRLLAEGRQALADRQYARARERFQRYLDSRPADPPVLLLAARAARLNREYTLARDYLGRCEAAGGDPEQIQIERALVSVELGDDSLIPPLRERASRNDELAAVILEVLIQHDLNTYQLASAREGFTRYLSLRPDDLHALLGRGFVWERFLSFSDALEDYRRAVAAHPHSERARLKLAETLLVAGTPDEALTHFRWLVERFPDMPPARLGLARCHRRLGRPEEAVRLLDALLREFPNHGETLCERGEIELDQGRPAAAEPFLRAAAISRPYDRRIQYAFYRCLLQLERRDEAAAIDARIRQLDADLRRLDALRDEVIQRPNDPDLRYEGGILFLRNGEREEGIRWLRLALRLDPHHQPAQNALSAALSNTTDASRLLKPQP